MLWSLIKIILFVVVVAALAWGAGYLLESEGGVQVTVMGTEYSFGPLQSVIAVGILVVAVWALLKLITLSLATWHFINGDETAISRYFDRNRERKGFDALSEGMMALASGEGRLALSKAQKADKYLNKPALTNLLTAQAAELAGDRRKAEETYRKLVEDEKTRFVGVRGILKQKLAEGDTDTALKLAEKAFALKPKHSETGDTLLQLQAGDEDWSGARKTLSAKLKHGQLPRDLHKRRDAVLAMSQARDAMAEGDETKAYELAIEANRLSPDLVPAAVMAAQGYIAQNQPRYASKVITKAWGVSPHPELAAAFAAIAADEKPAQRIKRFRTLTKQKPDHPEVKMLMAELHIANEDFPEARRALGDLVESDPTARSVTIMAAIERGQGASDTVVKGWLARAVTAPRDAQWVCDVDGRAYPEWRPVTEGGFDTLTWKRQAEPESVLTSTAQMLPLIVGAIEDQSEASADVEAEIEDVEILTGEPETQEAAASKEEAK